MPVFEPASLVCDIVIGSPDVANVAGDVDDGRGDDVGSSGNALAGGVWGQHAPNGFDFVRKTVEE